MTAAILRHCNQKLSLDPLKQTPQVTECIEKEREMLLSMWLLNEPFSCNDIAEESFYIRPLGRAMRLSTVLLLDNLSCVNRLFDEIPQGSATAVVSAHSSQLHFVIHKTYCEEEQMLLQKTIQNGRVQLKLVTSTLLHDPQLRLEITVFHDLETIWPFDIQLNPQRPQDKAVLEFLTHTAVWSLCFYIGTPESGSQMEAGFVQTHLPPLTAPSIGR